MTKKSSGSSRLTNEHRKKLFVEAYLENGGNATQAAIDAGYAKNSAHVTGSRLLKDAKVSGEINARLGEARETFELRANVVLRSLSAALHFDPRKLFNEDGSQKKPHEIDYETAMALDGIEVNRDGTVKYKAASRNAAREQAMKYARMYEQDNKPEGGEIAQLLRQISGSCGVIDAARERSMNGGRNDDS